MSQQKLSRIHPLVEHMMQHQDVSDWRAALVDEGVMSREEVIALDSKALQASYKTLKTIQLLHRDPQHILDEIERQNVCWKLELDDDYHQGAVCY